MQEHGRTFAIVTSLLCTYALVTSDSTGTRSDDDHETSSFGLPSPEAASDANLAVPQLRLPPPPPPQPPPPPSPRPVHSFIPRPLRDATPNKATQSHASSDDSNAAKWTLEKLNGRYTGVHDSVHSSAQQHGMLPNISHSFDGADDTSFVIATGASSDHACWLINMLASLHKQRPEWQVVVYDLGLQGDLNYTYLNAVHPKRIQLRRFQYANYPNYFRIDENAGEYAWKPIIIKEMVDEFGKVLWLDSGNSVGKKDNLTFVKDQLDSVGFYSPHSVGSLAEWTHPKTLEHFGVHSDATGLEPYKGKNNCNGAIVGFSKDSPAYHKVLVPWVNCAYNRNCIAPPGSNRSNHRQDQAALTVLAHQNGYTCYPTCKKGCHGITLHIDGMGWAKNVCNLLGIPNPHGKKKGQRW